MRSMVTSLFDSERITTTAPKAKEARRLAERLITRAKKGHTAHKAGQTHVALAHWRGAGAVVRNTDVLRKLFDQIAPHFIRNGGYTRIIRLDHMRVGDARLGCSNLSTLRRRRSR
jgi:large subunit ribosomal protein L17